MTTSNSPAITYHTEKLKKKQLLKLYKEMLYARMIEEKMLKLLRQGRISKWFSGIGQEAIAVGCTLAMNKEEYIFPMHRNLGVFTSRGIPLRKLFAQWEGKMEGFTKGRDRSFHFGTQDYKIVGMISHLAAQLSLAAGVGLAHKLGGEANVSLAFTGEGGTSEGEFHEALNMASVWKLPVIFVIENNGYGLSTPVSEQYACKQLADRAVGYGMEGITIDGNNVLEVYQTISKLAEDIRENPRPVLVECMTFRMRGHEEASGTKYVPEELMSEWATKDPISNYELFLLEEGFLDEEEILDLRAEYKSRISKELKEAEEFSEPTIKNEIEDVYKSSAVIEMLPEGASKEIRFIDAISQALDQSMTTFDDLVLMGQDIADYGGVFKITDGFLEKYGRERVRNTPICESAVLGIAVGLSLKGYKSVVEMQFSDFVSCGFNQIVNNMAKLYYRWGQNVDCVIRMPTGGSVGAGPFHSQSTEAWFTHTPGLKVVYPSNAIDAKGLLMSAIIDPNPVLFFEHKAMYRSISGKVPEDKYTIEIGKARIAREGKAFSIITYGLGVHWAKEVLDALEIDGEVLDLRSLQPLDYEAIGETVRKTNRVILLHEDSMFGGIGADLSAYIAEHLFEHLDAPLMRVASLDTPIPFNKILEGDYLPIERLKESIKKIVEY
ncbi:alpha-ketoacid dehydrogenase subunit alpha/beta [Portibacter lacus]|uniref:Dehydrogenase n=1 Tax=Portibacter lacus TaxID=1099794 RepID=A0AA37SQY3_9BACT|nr:dehydrogenase E1 component subunit alpha/beta [Portibacter lacus]GLR18054.1 dehydrogenase [Portibacter lacus]